MFATSIARLRTILTTEFTKYGLQSSELPTLSSTLLGFARLFTNQPKPRRSQYAPDLIGTGKPINAGRLGRCVISGSCRLLAPKAGFGW